MANYTAADIKALREKTGAGMMDVKKALDESDGDQTKAMEALRIKGLKGATKREGRSTSDGLVATSVEGGVGTMIELNSETDFVAKSEPFVKLSEEVLELAVANKADSAEALLAAETDGKPVSQFITESGASLGEKVELRRVGRVEGSKIASYLHRTNKDLPPQVGVLLAFEGDDETVAHDVAVHIAAMAPKYFSREDVPADLVENERRIAEDTAKNEGKPEQALPKIIEGRVNGFFKENCLLDQGFAKDPKQSVAKVLEAAGVKATGFLRYRVGA
ncbi:translation elongation factor Ts (EF-Ts) [Brevibacterium iodinum ATCC 49514]|jgi:elongation factor Ts|uniref:Elongation factor Ts n=2 Tax=Brevibacterium TaxID=1696 RepID=A0A5C4X0Y1_9MICO|nr:MULTISPECIES: translation elongation factor Ts [Brevibacterium]MCS4593738.1 translation elongation factor Ts [Brevibacterium sediminis]MCU4297773.1 elongation factor Ts [Brevibacterium permense]TNM54370.1 elongation factor Ts [Brevibacterium sediminis]UZD61243.1 translation elongation factor Ts [Brevibacterium sp. JSBI002]SMX73805.1 translation elongation factor Ts (EF-Ts) [Brevibacterium iodinum ATCC 49514]